MPTSVHSLRRFTSAGIAAFEAFVLSHSQGQSVPDELLNNPNNTEEFAEGTLDGGKNFESRFEFGQYLAAQLSHIEFAQLMAVEADPFWAWVAARYFNQLSAPTSRSKSPKKLEHFVVVRTGFKGSLHYRQGPRNCYELVSVHAESAKVCLCGPMGEFGDMAEQLTSRFSIARDVGYFRAACKLYLRGDKLVSGAASRARHPRKRTPTEKRGIAGAGRLAMAFKRLSLTFDTTEMTGDAVLKVLPPEFNKFKTD